MVSKSTAARIAPVAAPALSTGLLLAGVGLAVYFVVNKLVDVLPDAVGYLGEKVNVVPESKEFTIAAIDYGVSDFQEYVNENWWGFFKDNEEKAAFEGGGFLDIASAPGIVDNTAYSLAAETGSVFSTIWDYQPFINVGPVGIADDALDVIKGKTLDPVTGFFKGLFN